MKIRIAILVLVASLFSISSFAQQASKNPPGVSDQGYWVIESNVQTPLTHTIRFYTNANQLVYKETITNTRLNINRKKTRIMLQQVLETAIVAWNQNQQTVTDRDYVKLKLQ